MGPSSTRTRFLRTYQRGRADSLLLRIRWMASTPGAATRSRPNRTPDDLTERLLLYYMHSAPAFEWRALGVVLFEVPRQTAFCKTRILNVLLGGRLCSAYRNESTPENHQYCRGASKPSQNRPVDARNAAPP